MAAESGSGVPAASIPPQATSKSGETPLPQQPAVAVPGPFQPALAPPGPSHPLLASNAPTRRGRPGRRLYDVLLTRFDTQHLGYLTPDEQTQAMDFLQAKRPRVYAIVIQHFPSPAAFFQYLSQLPPPQP